MSELPEAREARLARKRQETAERILTPDNVALFNMVRDQLNDFPTVPIAATARGLGVSVDDLCRWIIGFKEPKAPALLPMTTSLMPRDPELRAELVRLRRREGSLVTIAGEAPRQLEVVQTRIKSLERAR